MPPTDMETAAAWSHALRDQSLRDLPYKIETNEYGQLVMSPLTPLHSYFQVRLTNLLRDHVDEPRIRLVEFAIETSVHSTANPVGNRSEESPSIA